MVCQKRQILHKVRALKKARSHVSEVILRCKRTQNLELMENQSRILIHIWPCAVIRYAWWIKKAESVSLELHLTKYLFTRVSFQKDQKESLNKPLTHVGLLTVCFDPSPNWPQLLLPNMYSLPFPEKKCTVRIHTSVEYLIQDKIIIHTLWYLLLHF